MFIIENGIVTLAVDGEFEVKLGITSDNLFAPWHVYKTKLFLRDPEEPGIYSFYFYSSKNIFNLIHFRTRTCSCCASKLKDNIIENISKTFYIDANINKLYSKLAY